MSTFECTGPVRVFLNGVELAGVDDFEVSTTDPQLDIDVDSRFTPVEQTIELQLDPESAKFFRSLVHGTRSPQRTARRARRPWWVKHTKGAK